MGDFSSMALDTELEQILRSNHSVQQEYRPRIFELPSDQIQLKELLVSDPCIEVVDCLYAQLRELVKVLQPQVKHTDESLEEAIINHLNGKKLNDYGVWVHYPWSRTLVHLLGEEEFALVRTDRNRNKITREEQLVLAEKKVGVIGLSVGQSVSLTMALERTFGEIRLADFDTLDLSNLNRIRSGARNLGLNKAVVTAREIAEIDPFLRVVCFTDGLTQANMDAFFSDGGNLDILVEECDSVDVKILARQKAKAMGIPVVMDSSDRGCLDVERFDLEPDRPILHGRIDHLDLDAARRPMSAEEKVPYMLPITGVETLSPRMKASVIELGRSISTWPQLATAVVLGGALAGDAVRRIALGQFRSSGRWHVDLDEQITDPEPQRKPPPPVPTAFALSPDLPERIQREQGPVPPSALALDHGLLERLVKAGAAAPSVGNGQPWSFVWSDRRLLLFHDMARSSSCWDQDHAWAHLALGACVENMVLQAHGCGLEVKVASGHGTHPTLYADLTFHPGGTIGGEPHEWDHLLDAVAHRRTYRAAGSKRHVPVEARTLLARTGSGAGLHYHWLDEEAQMQAVCGLVAIAERTRMMHPQGHHEYFGKQIRFTGPQNDPAEEGVAVGSLALPPMAEAAMRVLADPKAMDLLRQWNGGQAIGFLPAMHLGSSSALVLLTVDADASQQPHWEPGRAMQRFWLAAHQSGWGLQPLSSLIALKRTLAIDPGLFSTADATAVAGAYDRFERLFSLRGERPVCLFRLADPLVAHGRPRRRDITRLLHTHQPIHL